MGAGSGGLILSERARVTPCGGCGLTPGLELPRMVRELAERGRCALAVLILKRGVGAAFYMAQWHSKIRGALILASSRTPSSILTRGYFTCTAVPIDCFALAAFALDSLPRSPLIEYRVHVWYRDGNADEKEIATSPRARQDTNDHGDFKRPPLPGLGTRRRPSIQRAWAMESIQDQEDHDNIDVARVTRSTSISSLNRSSSSSVGKSIPAESSEPSLSDRTIETLSQLPSSPAIKQRSTNFFDPDPARRPQSRSRSQSRPRSRDSKPPSRPGSSYRSDASTTTARNRPGSSSEHDSISVVTPKVPFLPTVPGTPTRRGSMSSASTLATPRPLTKVPSRPSLSASVGLGTPHIRSTEIKHGSKKLAARPLKSRASVNGLFKKPTNNKRASLPSLSPSTASRATAADSGEDAPSSLTNRKSSVALREQIAKAKAAKRATSRHTSEAAVGGTSDSEKTLTVPTDPASDVDLPDDPFGQKKFESSNRKEMRSRIEAARTTGRLNISAMGLGLIPEDVLKMYDLEFIGRDDGSWAESVDLTRFVAADNELETIEDAVFPDTDPRDSVDDDGGSGHHFPGLEFLDLHNNSLITLPKGLRHLHFLTSLNLAHNKLTNNCLEIISQVATLRDLKLGHNLLYGAIDECFGGLENLEILDLQNNNISALPKGLANLSRLRILNLNENAFESLPFESLSKLPLTELQARKNALSGTLIHHPDVNGLSQLQTLDVSINRLTLLAPVTLPLVLPSLHQLSVSMNRLESLPNMESWTRLLTIAADENNITAFPEGLTSLEVRSIDLGSNEIRTLPSEIGFMDSLGMLRISGNPLRDKKFSSLTTEDLKAALAARLEPVPTDETRGVEQAGAGRGVAGSAGGGPPLAECDDLEDSRSEYEDFTTPPNSAPHSPERTRPRAASTQVWPIKAGGVLDRSNTESSSLHPVVCSKIVAHHNVLEVRLQHNTFTSVPESLSFFGDTLTTLCMSHNQLVGDSYIGGDELDLTALKELNLSSNRITSLVPLTLRLRAPNLEKLDVSLNRIVSLPVLRDSFPSLTILHISNNHLEQLEFESVKGMRSVDASNNDIAHLDPRLGLLGGSGNLEKLDVGGNRFRVPRWNVLERGTEATLRWLRGRVPVAEMAEWRARTGGDDEDGNLDDFD
ncbi:hypothetical protein DL771_000362 [Monosporascus sp. 5C6A]|nr:hypothetical protein DL771_000362 [Monosporascus sp. 5C6A]